MENINWNFEVASLGKVTPVANRKTKMNVLYILLLGMVLMGIYWIMIKVGKNRSEIEKESLAEYDNAYSKVYSQN